MNGTPRWFRPVAIVALFWNLLGCVAYLADVTISPERLRAMTAAQQALYAARPSWAVAGTALAVWFGAAGSLGLVMRRKWAVWPLIVSLVGVVVQDLWLFGLSRAAAQAGALAFVVQAMVLIVAIALVVLARKAATHLWLS